MTDITKMSIEQAVADLNVLDYKREYMETPAGVSHQQWLVEERGFCFLIAEGDIDGFKSYCYCPVICGDPDTDEWQYEDEQSAYEVTNDLIAEALRMYQKLYYY